MQEEYNSLMANNTWTLVPFFIGKKPVSWKWVLKIKQGTNGEVECYKAKLVARSFTQTYKVDYNETFVPVTKFASIRCILALPTLENMEIHQMDMKLHFLTASLKRRFTWSNLKGSCTKEVNILCVSFTNPCMV
jgi:hypothetical protein